jgi:predicted AAA+ superfamily ATPase
LHGALEEFKLNEGIVITEDTEAAEDIGGKKILFMPIWKWLLKP